jgi:hypothetical protein
MATRSPDLTPIDSFFRVYVNNYVDMDKIGNLNRVEARTGEGAKQTTRDMLQWNLYWT